MGETEWGGNWVLFWWVGLCSSLIQFSVDGRGCVPSLLFDLRPNYGGVHEDNGDLLQKVQCRHCHTQCPRLCSRPPTPPLETPGHSRASLGQSLVGSLLLSPGSWCTQAFVCAKSLFPQSYVRFGGSMVWLMATSSNKAYAISRSAAPRTPAAGYCWPVPPEETLKHSKTGLAQFLWGLLLWHKVFFEPLKCLWQVIFLKRSLIFLKRSL